MTAYLWATDPGTTIEPSAGIKASGHIPATPAAAKIENHVLHMLSESAVSYETKFAVEHDIADGTHTDVHADTITTADLIVTGGDTLIDAAGNIEATTLTLSGDIDCDDITADQIIANTYRYKSPFFKIERIYFFKNTIEVGTVTIEYDVTGVTSPTLQYQDFPKPRLPGSTVGVIIEPVEIQKTKDLQKIDITFVAYDNYTIDYEILVFTIFNGWGPTGITGSFSDGSISTDGQLITESIIVPDDMPDFAGHGKNISQNGIFGIKLTNSNADIGQIVWLLYYEITLWASTAENAVR